MHANALVLYGSLNIFFLNQGAQKLASKQQSERVTAQVRGVDIKQNCGPAAAAINTALAPLSNYFPNAFGVLVDCQVSPGCVQVRVDVPADDVLTDIDVCDLGKSLIAYIMQEMLCKLVQLLFPSCR